VVASHFPAKARTVRERHEATPEAVMAALKGRSYWHFATHGTFSWEDARRSGLYMAGAELLTMGRLLDAGGLGRPRLVVLSACETGLYDIARNPDEFIGLPGTFTALGAAGVLGTLWPVNDTATALLIAKFYELHMGAGTFRRRRCGAPSSGCVAPATPTSSPTPESRSGRAGSKPATPPRSSRS
jgi:CHAT domain-containing protein